MILTQIPRIALIVAGGYATVAYRRLQEWARTPGTELECRQVVTGCLSASMTEHDAEVIARRFADLGIANFDGDELFGTSLQVFMDLMTAVENLTGFSIAAQLQLLGKFNLVYEAGLNDELDPLDPNLPEIFEAFLVDEDGQEIDPPEELDAHYIIQLVGTSHHV